MYKIKNDKEENTILLPATLDDHFPLLKYMFWSKGYSCVPLDENNEFPVFSIVMYILGASISKHIITSAEFDSSLVNFISLTDSLVELAILYVAYAINPVTIVKIISRIIEVISKIIEIMFGSIFSPLIWRRDIKN